MTLSREGPGDAVGLVFSAASGAEVIVRRNAVSGYTSILRTQDDSLTEEARGHVEPRWSAMTAAADLLDGNTVLARSRPGGQTELPSMRSAHGVTYSPSPAGAAFGVLFQNRVNRCSPGDRAPIGMSG